MCGIFGIAGHEEASNLTYLGLYALQHRGQESAGIVSTNGRRLFKMRRKTLVAEAFDRDSFKYLRGDMAIGHVRYSTTGGGGDQNKQPFIGAGSFGQLAISHNGNLTNYRKTRRELEKQGSIFQSTSDTEVMLHMAARAEGETVSEKIAAGMHGVEGAYSALFLTDNEMIAVRDPQGYRPLVMGKLGKATVFASETCAFDLIGAKYKREIQPGEMIIAHSDGSVKATRFMKPGHRSSCVFEHIYFARPDSTVFGSNVYDIRKRLGVELAREHQLKADVVTPVPDSGVMAAMGYAEEAGIPFQMGFIRNHYVGRTFIEPKNAIRGFGVKLKLNPVPSILAGKRVAVVDDSVVRGNTSKRIVKMIRDAGAKEVYLLISSPPVTAPCYYGIDTPTRKELVGSSKTVEEIRKFIGADKLAYLSMEGVYRAVEGSDEKFCDACFTGNYPTPVEPMTKKSKQI